MHRIKTVTLKKATPEREKALNDLIKWLQQQVPRQEGSTRTIIPRDIAVSLGALFFLACREHLGQTDIISDAAQVCEDLVEHLEFHTGEAW